MTLDLGAKVLSMKMLTDHTLFCQTDRDISIYTLNQVRKRMNTTGREWEICLSIRWENWSMQLAENDKFAYPHSVEQTSIYDWKALKKIHTKKKNKKNRVYVLN